MTLLNKFVPEVTYDNIGSYRTKMSIDGFVIGKQHHVIYNKRTKFVCLAKEVYVLENVISKIGKTLSKANFISEDKNTGLEKKLQTPNLKQSEQEFLKEFAFYLKAAGWVVMWKKYISIGNFDSMELINLDPDKTDFASNGNIISEYDGEEVTIELDKCIFFYDSIREKDGKGYSKIRPLKSQVENVLNAQRAKGIQIENSGTTIVSPKVSAMQNSVDKGLDKIAQTDVPGQPTQKQQIEDKFNNAYGIENRFIVASQGLDALNLSAGLNNVKFDDIVETDKLAIYDAFGVSIELSPYGKNATDVNKETAELGFIESEIIPLAENLVNTLNAEFPTRGKLKVSFDHLNSMSIVAKRVQETQGTAIDQYSQLLKDAVIDIPTYQRLLKAKNIAQA